MDIFDLPKDLQEKAKQLKQAIEDDFPRIMEVEGLNHFEASFDNEGFEDKTVEKWQPRKTTDSRGRDKTRYRTNRVGRAGGLTSFGRKNQGRAILTGHNTGGNKLRLSIMAKVAKASVVFSSDKKYAKRHNEGTDGMPKRQFMGHSEALDKKVFAQFQKITDKILKG